MAIDQNIKVAVDALVFDISEEGIQILLIERKNKANGKSAALPGGFIENDETPLEAVIRELKEETGISIDNFEQLYAFGAVDRDPRFRVISIAHLATTSAEKHFLQASSDAKKAKWVNIQNLPELAFDHSEIIEKALAKLRAQNKIN